MDRRAALVALAAAALVWAGLAAPLLHGQVYVFNDLGLVHLPMRAFYAEALAAGDSFLWWPNQFTGVYLHGEGQGGFLHPVQWVGYRVLPLAWAFQLELLRGAPFALLGAFLLLRRWRLDAGAALAGAFAAAFSGFGFLHHMHPNLVGVWAHTAWLLLCVDVALRAAAPRRRALARLGLVVLVASQLLLGHPQASFLSLLVAGLYAAFLAARQRQWPALVGLAVAVALGCGAAAVQVLPTLESFAASSRAAAGPDFAATPALAPADLAQLVGPYLFEDRVAGGIPWERGAWPGAVPLLLAVWLLLRGREVGRARALGLFGLALAALGLWLSLGDAGGLYRLQRSLPGLGFLRAPARYVAVFQLGLALASAVALHDLARLAAPVAWRRLAPLALPAALAALVLGVTLAAGERHGLPVSASWLGRLAGAGWLLLAGSCVAAAARGARVALPLLVALLALDLGSYGLSFVRAEPAQTPAAFVAGLPAPALAPGQRALAHPVSLAMRVPLANGYLALVPERRMPFTSQAALRAAAVGFTPGGGPLAPLPRARLVTRARVSTDPVRDLSRVDLAREALVEREISLQDARAGTARIVRDRPGEIVVATRSPGRQLLVVSESHHPGWRARIDGRTRCDVERVNGDYLGCVVGAGEHEVSFRFEPDSLRQGAWVSAGSGAAALAWLGVGALRSRRPEQEEGAA